MRKRTGFAAATLAMAVLAITGLRGRLRRYAIAEESMAPALHGGDFVLAQTITGAPRRGDIVVFEHPGRPGFKLVKRVIGLPSETVTIHNSQVHIDGEILAEPWADGPTRPDGEWRLDDDELFVLSDARPTTIADGRAFGPIRLAAARWRVRFRYWPPRAVGRV